MIEQKRKVKMRETRLTTREAVTGKKDGIGMAVLRGTSAWSVWSGFLLCPSEVSWHQSSWIILLEHNDLFQLALGSYLPGGASRKKSKREVMFLCEKKNTSCCSGLHLLCPAMSANWSPFFVENAFCYLLGPHKPQAISWAMKFHGLPNGARFRSLFHFALPGFSSLQFLFSALPRNLLCPDGAIFMLCQTCHTYLSSYQEEWNILSTSYPNHLFNGSSWMILVKWKRIKYLKKYIVP